MKINYGALFMGWLIAHVGQIVFNKSSATMVLRSVEKGATGEAQLMQAADKVLSSAPLHIAQLVAQIIIVFFAVYVALQIAENALFTHALALGILIMLSTLIFWLSYWKLWPWWYSMFAIVLPIPTALSAEIFRTRQLTKSSKPTSIPAPQMNPTPQMLDKQSEKPKERPKW